MLEQMAKVTSDNEILALSVLQIIYRKFIQSVYCPGNKVLVINCPKKALAKVPSEI